MREGWDEAGVGGAWGLWGLWGGVGWKGQTRP